MTNLTRYGIVAMLFLTTMATYTGLSARAQEVAAEQTKSADPELPPQWLKLAGGKLRLPVPGNWQMVPIRSRIIKREYAVPPASEGEAPGRMTVSTAGGGIEANVERWIGQFQTAEGEPLADEAKKVEKKKIGGLEVHLVDLTGDFQDQPRGPRGPTVSRPNYRMLAAIVPLKEGGTWFFKFYGAKETVDAQAKPFTKMIEGIKASP